MKCLQSYIYAIVMLCMLPVTHGLANSMSQKECDSLTIAAASLMSNRSKTASKEGLLNALPSLEQPPYKKNSAKYLLLQEMHTMVHEVFEHEALNPSVYMVFKGETCLKAMQGKPAPSYTDAYPELKVCADLSDNNEMIGCSMRAAEPN